MAWSSSLDAEVPLGGTNADYDRHRRAFYLATLYPRDDKTLPKIAPPGWNVTRQRDDGGGPAGDTAWKPGPMVTTSTVRWLRPDGGAPVGGVYQGTSGPATDRTGAVLTKQVVTATREDESKRVVGDEKWWDSDFGMAPGPNFVPPAVLGQYGYEPSELHTTSEHEDEQLVAVRNPHQYLTLPEPAAYIMAYTESGGAARGGGATLRYGLYRSRVVVTGHGDRQEPHFHEFPPPGTRAPGGGNLDTDWGTVRARTGARGFWMGQVSDEDHAGIVAQAIGEVQSLAAREGAVAILVQAAAVAASVVTAGAVAPLVGAAFEAAAFGAASGAAATGADGPLILASANAAPAAPAVKAVAAAAPVVMPVVAPEQTNAVLAEAAKGSIYLDGMGPIQDLEVMAFRELAIRAQRTREARDELRLEVARRQAELNAQPWYQYARAALEVAKQVVVNVFVPGGGALLAGFEAAMAQLALAAGSMALKMLSARETMAAMERLIADSTSDELRALDAEIAALEAQYGTATGAVAPTSFAPTARDPWYGPLVRFAEREWGSTGGRSRTGNP